MSFAAQRRGARTDGDGPRDGCTAGVERALLLARHCHWEAAPGVAATGHAARRLGIWPGGSHGTTGEYVIHTERRADGAAIPDPGGALTQAGAKEPRQVTHTSLNDPIEPALIGELRSLLVGGGILEGINLRITEQDGWVQLHIMALSMGSLGVLLATLSDPAELDDPKSLTCRITPGDHRVGPDLWQYELIASRYPTDKSLVFAAKIRLPTADLPEVVSRLRQPH